jgi:hypothetical protein
MSGSESRVSGGRTENFGIRHILGGVSSEALPCTLHGEAPMRDIPMSAGLLSVNSDRRMLIHMRFP